MYLYSQLQQNTSFLMNETDISRFFEEVLVFEAHQTANKDWIALGSHTGMPSFSRFEVARNDNICIRLTAPSKIKQTLVLVREAENKQYTFVGSSFAQDSTTVELSLSVFPGKYIIAAFHDWRPARSGRYHVFLASHEHLTLQKGSLIDNDFMGKALMSLEQTRVKNQKEEKEECTIRMELERLGIVYMVLKPGNTKQKEFTIKIDQKRLENEGWEVLEPYRGLDEVTVSDSLNRAETLLLLYKPELDLSKKQYFPMSAFSLKK
jgi:hypothetical protein